MKVLLLIELIAAVRNNDDGGGKWVQLLVFILVVVFWLIGGIAKTRARRFEEAPPDEGKGGPRLRQKMKGSRHAVRMPARRVARPQPQARATEIQPVAETFAEPLAEEQVSFAQQKFVKLKGLGKMKMTGKTEPMAQPSIDLKFDDSDDLKRAILHYEILGKPISLRNPGM